MTDLRKAAEMALEFVSWFASDDHSVRPKHKAPEIKEALRQALAQPEQESVICRNIYEVWAGSDGVPIPETIVEAYLLRLIEQMRDEASKGLKPSYTAPPNREWVGLTDEELDEAMEYWSDDSRSTYGGARMADGEYVNMRDTWRYIEAKLKEKNT